MKTYYRFLFSTEEILEFDTNKVSLGMAKTFAREWAENSDATYEYYGIVEHEEI